MISRWRGAATGLLAATTLACVVPAPGAGDTPAPATDTSATTDAPERLTVTLYFAATDGPWLVTSTQEVPRAEGTLAQGRAILEAQLGEAPENLISPFPAGTRLRGFYITARDEAFVDLSAEVAAAHAGGALNEQLTVYTVVNALTTNLPSIQRVQILIGGREVDTLAGHLDLRWPLETDLTLTRSPSPD
jgi:spore germination protein GerM